MREHLDRNATELSFLPSCLPQHNCKLKCFHCCNVTLVRNPFLCQVHWHCTAGPPLEVLHTWLLQGEPRAPSKTKLRAQYSQAAMRFGPPQ